MVTVIFGSHFQKPRKSPRTLPGTPEVNHIFGQAAIDLVGFKAFIQTLIIEEAKRAGANENAIQIVTSAPMSGSNGADVVMAIM